MASALLNDISSPLALLESRRSGRPRDLVAPGPAPDQLRRILTIAMRTPDHGKLAPWRFVHVPIEGRPALAALLERAYRLDHALAGRVELASIARFAHQAPTLIVALSEPVVDSKIPIWEQRLSCGAAVMNLLLAAHALGFAGGWVTGWAAASAEVLRAFGGGEEARIAGFIFLGTPAAALEERPRPAATAIVSEWPPGPNAS